MWPRVAEVAIACWLAISPFIFSHPSEATSWWLSDLGSAAVIALVSLASFWRPLGYAHLVNLLVAGWLVGFAWFTSSPGSPAPALQNELVAGLLLALFAILPSQASLPPRAWRKALGEEAGE